MINALLVEEVEVADEEEPEAPPLMYWPTVPFKPAIVPPVGAVRTAAAILFWAVRSAACAPLTWAFAVVRSVCVGPAVLEANVACCVFSAEPACATLFCDVCRLAFCWAIVLCRVALDLSSADCAWSTEFCAV